MKRLIQKLSLDEPVEFAGPKRLFKKNRIRVFLINEDLSYKEYFVKFPQSYVIDIKRRSYLVLPKAIINGKYPTIVYYYNNPSPILFEFQYGKISALDLRDKKQIEKMSDEEKITLSNIALDSESINLAFNTRVMRGLYARPRLTTKALLIIMAALVVVILVFLQVFGVVDIVGAFSGKGGG